MLTAVNVALTAAGGFTLVKRLLFGSAASESAEQAGEIAAASEVRRPQVENEELRQHAGDAPLVKVLAALALGAGLGFTVAKYVFRSIPITDSGASRTPVSGQADHRFRSKPITCSRVKQWGLSSAEARAD
ncbi:hypothetical protein ACN469_26570 [Corallococcus terminator]